MAKIKDLINEIKGKSFSFKPVSYKWNEKENTFNIECICLSNDNFKNLKIRIPFIEQYMWIFDYTDVNYNINNLKPDKVMKIIKEKFSKYRIFDIKFDNKVSFLPTNIKDAYGFVAWINDDVSFNDFVVSEKQNETLCVIEELQPIDEISYYESNIDYLWYYDICLIFEMEK